jgi:ribosomal protein S14
MGIRDKDRRQCSSADPARRRPTGRSRGKCWSPVERRALAARLLLCRIERRELAAWLLLSWRARQQVVPRAGEAPHLAQSGPGPRIVPAERVRRLAVLEQH